MEIETNGSFLYGDRLHVNQLRDWYTCKKIHGVSGLYNTSGRPSRREWSERRNTPPQYCTGYFRDFFNTSVQLAAHILQDTANGKNYVSDKHTGARRLQDARVLEYQPQRVPKNDILVPDWHTPAYNELGLHN